VQLALLAADAGRCTVCERQYQRSERRASMLITLIDDAFVVS
jgi:hypothetical protein